MKKRKTRFPALGFSAIMGVGLAITGILFGSLFGSLFGKPVATPSQIPSKPSGGLDTTPFPQFGIPPIITSPTSSVTAPSKIQPLSITPTRSPLDFFTDITQAPSVVNQPSITPTTQTVNIVTGAVQPSAFAPSPGASIIEPVQLLFPSGVNAQSFQAWWGNLTGAISALQAGRATFSSSLTNLPISNKLPDGTPFPGGLNSSDLPILQSAFNTYLKTAQALGLA